MSRSKPRVNLKEAGAAALNAAIAQALKALQDPETQAKIAEQASDIAESVRTWKRERKARLEVDVEPGEGLDLAEVVGNLFGQGKLEQRVENLRTSIGVLGDGRPDLAEALAPVRASVDQIGVALQVAGSMPVVKRKRAHRKIDDALDGLEVGLFQAAFPEEADAG